MDTSCDRSLSPQNFRWNWSFIAKQRCSILLENWSRCGLKTQGQAHALTSDEVWANAFSWTATVNISAKKVCKQCFFQVLQELTMGLEVLAVVHKVAVTMSPGRLMPFLWIKAVQHFLWLTVIKQQRLTQMSFRVTYVPFYSETFRWKQDSWAQSDGCSSLDRLHFEQHFHKVAAVSFLPFTSAWPIADMCYKMSTLSKHTKMNWCWRNVQSLNDVSIFSATFRIGCFDQGCVQIRI